MTKHKYDSITGSNFTEQAMKNKQKAFKEKAKKEQEQKSKKKGFDFTPDHN